MATLRIALLLFAASLLAAACAVSTPPKGAMRSRGRGAPSDAAASVSVGAAPSASVAASALDPPIAAKNRECERCHEDVAAEWRGSLHHLSWDDPVFLSAYALEPGGFCRECHVPEANPAEPAPPASLRRLGIGCVTCHVRGGSIVGVAPLAGSKEGHAVVGDASLSTVAACARCHEFDFPKKQEALMQGTVTEHGSSPHKAAPCRDCHMPLVEASGKRPHRSHEFRVAGDVALLRSAVTARAARDPDNPRAVVVTLATGRVGHDFPTGDMFRRVTVRAWLVATEAEGETVAPPVVLAREFEMVPGKQGIDRRQTGDNRLPASGAPQAVKLVFPAGVEGRAVRWAVVYQRMGDTMARLFGLDPAADEVIVAEGTLPAAGALPTAGTFSAAPP